MMAGRIQPKRFFLNELDEYAPIDAGSEQTKKHLRRLSMDLCEKIAQHVALKDKECDGGLYVGMGGVGYAMWHASHNLEAEQRKTMLGQALKYLQYHTHHDVKHGDKHDRTSFLLGTCGLLTATALLSADLGHKQKVEESVNELAKLADKVVAVKFLKCGSDELFVGRSGYLCAILNIRLKLNLPVISDDKLTAIMSSMLVAGRSHPAAKPPAVPLMYSYYDTEYLGAAHGLSSILQMLLSFPHLLQKVDAKAEHDVHRSVDYILSLQQHNGNFPCAMDELHGERPQEDELVHWCHGASGIIYLMARAYKVWKDEKYLAACKRCGEIIWQKGLLRKGPGICHGVAGSAYAFILLYQLTNDPKYLRRAHLFVNFIQTDVFRGRMLAPDCPWSLFEGVAGLMCLYSDLINPNTAHFPLIPINV